MAAGAPRRSCGASPSPWKSRPMALTTARQAGPAEERKGEGEELVWREPPARAFRR
jgi:hypothetical protein